MTPDEIIALIQAAETIYGAAAKAIQSSKELSKADRDTLVDRIKQSQAVLPEWDC